jgi:hypothetical protein
MMPAIKQANETSLRQQLLGVNQRLPGVGIIYNGMVSKAGSVLSKDIYFDAFADFRAVELFLEHTEAIAEAL